MYSVLGLKLDKSSKDFVDGKVVGVSHDLYMKGCVQDVSQGIKYARDIGYPVMIKASEGGGGKGIRKASSDDEFTNFFRQVQCMCLLCPLIEKLMLFSNDSFEI